MQCRPSKIKEHLQALFRVTPHGLEIKSDDEMLAGLKSLPQDIDFNFVDGVYNNPLYLAAANNHVKCVRYLLEERRVNPNVKVSDKLTAAHIAAMCGFVEVLTLLVKCPGIQLSELDQFGETPLFRAIGNAPVATLEATVKLLIESDPKCVLIPNEDNVEPLGIALMRKRLAVINLLIKAGAVISDTCYATAGNMMQACAKPTNNGFMVLLHTADNEATRNCARVIITTYNERNNKNKEKDENNIKKGAGK